MTVTHSILLILVVSVVTALLRFLPFLIFSGRETPKFIAYLGKVLPFAVMGMLCVYCLRGTSLFAYPYGLPEIIACEVVVLLHLTARNTLLSIAGGTACYMLLVQTVF